MDREGGNGFVVQRLRRVLPRCQRTVVVPFVELVVVHSDTASAARVGPVGVPSRHAIRYAERMVVVASRSGRPAAWAASPSTEAVVSKGWPSSTMRQAAQNSPWLRAPS